MNPSHLVVGRYIWRIMPLIQFMKIYTTLRCGTSFALEIVSEQFEGKRLLERHRLVNAALGEEMKQIHALSIKKAQTPEQWKQQQESEVSKPTS
ncbi:hypothetical protein HS088_TW07G00741 [Tripterygium wilfordii]|uniref:BolA-like family protein n=1 Tax=Tripterygium wilfordii TaxID=458696 RepID=A0A7J7DFL6_TRIWF|nr:hypothetical protein HS088_TW07G00741 [Tripterygium wilfordii]